MNITLRKANALQNSIRDALHGIRLTFSLEINEFQEVEAELKKANDAIFAADARRQKLLLALYNIRGLVATANSSSGIDLALTKAAFIDKRIGQLEEFIRIEPMTELPVIKGQLEKIRNRSDDSRLSAYNRFSSVSTTVVTQAQIDQAKAEILNLKKQKQKLNDEILELNIKTEIPLTDDVVATLQAEGLI